MYCSSHEMPLYPGTGARSERGEHNTIVNAPLRAGDGGEAFRAEFDDALRDDLNAPRAQAAMFKLPSLIRALERLVERQRDDER